MSLGEPLQPRGVTTELGSYPGVGGAPCRACQHRETLEGGCEAFQAQGRGRPLSWKGSESAFPGLPMCSSKRGAWPMLATSVKTQMSPDNQPGCELFSAENTERLTEPHLGHGLQRTWPLQVHRARPAPNDLAVASGRARSLSKPPQDSFLNGNSSTTI